MEMEMEKQLYEAALEGDVTLLKTLLQKDPLILDRISPTFLQETPLHVAILRGHVDFAREVLSRNPRSIYELDSLGHSPLHAAAAKGRVEIVRELLRLDHATGLVRSKDGMVPLHLAVMKGGRVEVVSELARGCPQSLTRSRTDQGDTGLHLCVKYDNLEALQVLMEMQENFGVNLLNVTNYDGNTVLHLAALHKNLEIMKYLLSKPGIEMNAVNKNGLTCLDLVENSPRDIKGLEIHNFLLQSNAQKGLNCNTYTTPPVKSLASVDPGQRGPKSSWKRFFTFSDNPRLEENRGALIIAAIIIAAAMAVPIINMNVNGPDLTTEYSKYSVTFVPSAAIVVLLVSGFSLSNKLCVWIIVQLMYTAIGFLGLNFIGSVISNENRYTNIDAATLILMLILFVLLMLASALNIIRLIVWVVTSVKGCVQRRMLSASSTNALSSA